MLTSVGDFREMDAALAGKPIDIHGQIASGFNPDQQAQAEIHRSGLGEPGHHTGDPREDMMLGHVRVRPGGPTMLVSARHAHTLKMFIMRDESPTA